MQPIGLVPLVGATFALRPDMHEGSLQIAVTGNGDMSTVEALSRYLRQVHTVVVELALAEVRFDFRDLYFLNSSCLKEFVTWICGAVESSPKSFKVRFVTNPKLLWQRRSLEALQRLAPNTVQIEL